MASAIWKAFDLMNSGKLRDALETDNIPSKTIDALVDIIAREEYRLNRLMMSRE